nr:hypothetical protein B7L51_19410 [Pectobacterium carotovorum]
MLTDDEKTEYEKGCLYRSWGVSYEGYPLCCACNARMVNGETYAHAECADRLLEGEVTERVRSEDNAR